MLNTRCSILDRQSYADFQHAGKDGKYPKDTLEDQEADESTTVFLRSSVFDFHVSVVSAPGPPSFNDAVSRTDAT